MNQPPITPRFRPGAIVRHVADPDSLGIVVAFMVRGLNHSFEVQWGVKDREWHLDFEIEERSETPREIGFWPSTGEISDNKKP